MKECKNGFPMEYFLMFKSKNVKIHKRYGTYIFGPLNQEKFIKHTDGKRTIL